MHWRMGVQSPVTPPPLRASLRRGNRSTDVIPTQQLPYRSADVEQGCSEGWVVDPEADGLWFPNSRRLALRCGELKREVDGLREQVQRLGGTPVGSARDTGVQTEEGPRSLEATAPLEPQTPLIQSVHIREALKNVPMYETQMLSSCKSKSSAPMKQGAPEGLPHVSSDSDVNKALLRLTEEEFMTMTCGQTHRSADDQEPWQNTASSTQKTQPASRVGDVAATLRTSSSKATSFSSARSVGRVDQATSVRELVEQRAAAEQLEQQLLESEARREQSEHALQQVQQQLLESQARREQSEQTVQQARQELQQCEEELERMREEGRRQDEAESGRSNAQREEDLLRAQEELMECRRELAASREELQRREDARRGELEQLRELQETREELQEVREELEECREDLANSRRAHLQSEHRAKELEGVLHRSGGATQQELAETKRQLSEALQELVRQEEAVCRAAESERRRQEAAESERRRQEAAESERRRQEAAE
eukprot:Hpha_TRINITY_DN16451_c0_g1::TRINITY_DN16451_c0_g1_i1::g.163139::m.163139